jgi:hypothetical protein
VEIGGLNYQTPVFTTNRDRLSTYMCQGTTSTDYGLVFMNGGITWGEASYKLIMTAASFGRTCQTTVLFDRTSPTAPVPVQPNLQVQLAGPSIQPLIRNIYASAMCVNCLLPVLPGFPNRVESACVWDISIETLAADWIPYTFGVIRRAEDAGVASRSLTFHSAASTLPADTQFRFKVCCTPASLLEAGGGSQSGLSAACGYAEFATAPGPPDISSLVVTPTSGEANVCRLVSWKASSTAVLSCKALARVDVGFGPQDMPFTNGGVTEDNVQVCYLPTAASTEVCVSCCDNFDSCTTRCAPVVSMVPSSSSAWDKINSDILVAGAGSPLGGYLTAVMSSWGPAPSVGGSLKEATTSFVAEVTNTFLASVNTQDSTTMGPSEVSRASAMVSTLSNVLGTSPETVSSTAISNVLLLGTASAASLKNAILANKANSASDAGISNPMKTEVMTAIDATLRSFGTALKLNKKLNEAGSRRRLTDIITMETTEQAAKTQIIAAQTGEDAERQARQAEVDKLVAKIADVRDPEERAVLLNDLLLQLSDQEADRVDKLYAQSLLANGFSDLMADVSGTLSSILTTSDDPKEFTLGSGSLVIGRTTAVTNPTVDLSLDPLSAGSYTEVGYAVASYSLDPWAHLPSSPVGAFLLQSSTLYSTAGDRLSFAAADRAHVFFADKLTYASGSCYWLDPSGTSALGNWRTDGLVNSADGCLGDTLRGDAGAVAVFVDLAEPTRVFVSTSFYQDSKSVWVLFSAVTVSVLIVVGSTLLVAFYLAVNQDRKERKLPPKVPGLGDGVSGPRSLADPIHYKSTNMIMRMIMTFVNILKRDHLLIAPFFPDPALKLKRTNRVAALFCAIAGCFVIPAILYGAAPASDFAHELHFMEAAVLTALLVFPLAKITLMLFVSKPEQPLYPSGNADPVFMSSKSRWRGVSGDSISPPPTPPIRAPTGLPPVVGSAVRSPTRAFQSDRPSDLVASLPVLPPPVPPATLPQVFPSLSAVQRKEEGLVGVVPPGTPRREAALPPAVVDVDVDTKDLLYRVRRQYVNDLLAKSTVEDEREGVPMAARSVKTSHSPVSVIAQALAYATCVVFVTGSSAVTTVYVRNFNQALSTDWLLASVVALALLLVPFELLKTTVMLLVEFRKLLIRKRLLEDKLIERKCADIKRPVLVKPPKIRPPYFENIPRPPPTPPPVLRGGLTFLDMPPTPRVDLLNT